MLLVSLASLSQNNTNSPFSRYGYGEMNDNVPGAYRALGGVGIGMRESRVINPSQPASYTVVDSTTFMFDLAASAMWNNYKDAGGVRNRANGNLEYITMQFPVWKQHIGMSLGVMPYSMVGYNFSSADSIHSDYHYVMSYDGTGGITEVYGGLSFNLFNWFAAGANIYYMFGRINNSSSIAFTENLRPVTEINRLHINDIRFRFGAQIFHTFEHHAFSVGAVFENKSKLNGDVVLLETSSADTISSSSLPSEFPMIWGVGAMYKWSNRVLVSADYMRYCWASAAYFDKSMRLQDRQKISVGFEYTHNPLGRRYIDHMPWRLGVSVSDPYVSSVAGKEFTVSIGTAFPLHNVATVFNTTLEWGRRGADKMLVENYLRLTVNVSVSENWFFKRRL